MKYLRIITALLFFQHLSVAQCDFTATGIGGFNSAADQSNFNMLTEAASVSYGSFSLSTTEVQEGASSLQIDVTADHSWAVRMFNNACTIPVTDGNNYEISFWVKGDIGNEVKIYLYAGASSNNQEITSIFIETSGWEYHTVSLSSNETNTGGIKFAFTNTGTYYLDGVTVVDKDCNGEIGGTASVDNCGICAGGNTGITPDSFCNLIAVTPDDANLHYEGTLYENINSTQAELSRFAFDFFNDGSDGYWNESKANTQSGVSIRLKTDSPIMRFKFSELANSEQRADNFAVFKDGELYQEGIGTDTFTVTNFSMDLAEWTITLPSFDGMVFNGLDIVDGYSLQTMTVPTKLQYFAIGNSITHGVGQDNAGHLTYPYLIADSLDFEVHNLGIGGSKITDQIMTNFVGQTADVITILWGYNDVNNATDLGAVGGAYDRYTSLIDSLCKSQSQAEIYAILPTPTNTIVGKNNPANTIADLTSNQQSILTTAQATCPNLHIVNSHDYVTNPAGLNDDVHLNIQGADDLANGLIAEMHDCNDDLFGDASLDVCNVCSGGNTGVTAETDISNCTTSLEGEINGLTIYPNPTSSIVSLSEEIQWVLTNAYGVVLDSGTGNQIDLSGKDAGVYLLKTGGQVIKIVKE